MNGPASRIAAIFDLDETLIAGTTATMVAKYLRQTGQLERFIPRSNLLAILGVTLLFRLGLANATHGMQVTAQSARGRTVAEMWEMTNQWFDEMVVHTIVPGAIKVLEWHQHQGHTLVLCTASSQFSALPIARHLGIQHSVCSEWEHHNGIMTGHVRLPIAYGVGKVHWLRRLADEIDIDLSQSHFYSDHQSDLPMLELVAHPVAVNPTQKLAALAKRRGWQVVDWRVE